MASHAIWVDPGASTPKSIILVLRRDAGELTFERAMVYLLAPVRGRAVGAVVRGEGRFRLTPPDAVERAELQRFTGAPGLDDAVSEAILIFSDSTAAQLRGLVFRPAQGLGTLGDRVHDLLVSLEGENAGALRSDVIGPLLNGETTSFFLARLERSSGGAILFEIDPDAAEAVRLYRPMRRARPDGKWAVVTQFAARTPLPGGAGAWALRQRLSVPGYGIEVRLTPTFTADLDSAARATLALRADEPIGPWLRFALHPKLVVDSAWWGAGEPANAFKAKDDETVWVRAPRQLDASDSLTLTLCYHGNFIDRYGDWFVSDPGAAWYPQNGQGRDFANFDVTYHAPSWYPLASVGERIDSSVAGKVLTTRWVTRRATPFATFNLGLFESYYTRLPGAPPLDILISESAHRALARELHARGYLIPQQKNMRENVAADVANSLKLFTFLFGECFYGHFYVTEIPYNDGVSFPGMIDLSWSTFHNTSLDGFDEFFRAHGVAHQWWGSGVEQGSYRDKWLSEGLASFSALWYVQSERKGSSEYFKFFDHYKDEIKSLREETGPIWIGYRNATPQARNGYDVMIYEKGAWVFHMLRTMMLDLRTMKEDRFIEMMRDYYASYRGKPATTDDFQRVVERHAGIPMDRFFDQWVRGTAIPTYHVAWTAEPAGGDKYAVRLRVTQEHLPADFRMPVLVSVGLGANRFAHFRIDVHGGETRYVSPLIPGAPNELSFNELHSVLADVKMERW